MQAAYITAKISKLFGFRIDNMEEEFRTYSKEMQAKQEAILKEKNELQADFDNLTNASMRDRQVLQDLITRTQQQDLVIRTQQEAIAARVKHWLLEIL